MMYNGVTYWTRSHFGNNNAYILFVGVIPERNFVMKKLFQLNVPEFATWMKVKENANVNVQHR